MKKHPAIVAVVLATLGIAAACSSTLDIKNYDRACSVNEDCEVVFVGDVCECSCDGRDGLSKKGREEYSRDRSDISCSNQCKPCANNFAPVCNSGQCAAQKCSGQVKFCAPTCGAPPTIEACECPSGTFDNSTCSQDAGSTD